MSVMRAIFVSLRCFVIASACALLAGCISVPPHSLTAADLQRYGITEVTVTGAEVIRSWPSEEENFLRTGAVDPETANRIRSEPAYNFPQLTNHFRQALTARVGAELPQLTRDIFTGRQPAQAQVRLKTFDVPSVARRVFLESRTAIQADIDIVDKATGRVVLHYSGPLEAKPLIGGLRTGIAVAFESSDLGYAMMTDYLTAYRNWLLRN
jgi:hypothetical protein